MEATHPEPKNSETSAARHIEGDAHPRAGQHDAVFSCKVEENDTLVPISPMSRTGLWYA